jgi:DNA-binding GntR family transcriptional regulator
LGGPKSAHRRNRPEKYLCQSHGSKMVIRSLSQQVYDFIVTEINIGHIQLGQKINENELMKKLPTSRTPIREALIQLAADGVLENIPRKGFFVRTISPQVVAEYYYCVAYLDFYAMKLAIPNLTDRDYRKMEVIIDDINATIEARNLPEYVPLTDQFHGYYYNMSGNGSMSSVIFGIRDKCLRATYYDQNEDALFAILAEVNQEHRMILELARENNLPALETLLIKHWTKIEKDLFPSG